MFEIQVIFWFSATLKPTSVQHSYNKSVFRTSKAPHYYNTKNIREKCRAALKTREFQLPYILIQFTQGAIKLVWGDQGAKIKGTTAKRNEDVDEKKRA